MATQATELPVPTSSTPLLGGNHNFASVGQKILEMVTGRTLVGSKRASPPYCWT